MTGLGKIRVRGQRDDGESLVGDDRLSKIVNRRIPLRVVNPASPFIEIVVAATTELRMVSFRSRTRTGTAGPEIVDHARAVRADEPERLAAGGLATGAGACHPHGAVFMSRQGYDEKCGEAGQKRDSIDHGMDEWFVVIIQSPAGFRKRVPGVRNKTLTSLRARVSAWPSAKR